MVILSLTLFCQAFQAAAIKGENKSFSIQNINKTDAIYLDPLGDVEIISASWNLVIYYNMDAYFHIIKKSNVLIQKIRIVCGKLLSFEDQCNIVLDNMQNQLVELNNIIIYICHIFRSIRRCRKYKRVMESGDLL